MIDIGANLTNKRFHHDLEQVLARAQQAGVERIVVTGTSLQCSEQALALTQQYPHLLSCTAGVHPHDASSWNRDVAEQIKTLAQQPSVRAVGECGLDFNRDFSPRDQQEVCFQAQLELAAELEKPVFLHERDAYSRFASILSPYMPLLADAVVHCFTGSKQALKHYLDMGCYIGITGWVCDERRGQSLRELVSYIPADRLLIETDAPYLLPRTIRPKPKSSRNEPAFLSYLVSELAQIRAQSEAEIAQASSRAAYRFFRF
jgi:TatD DNase family protein